MLEHAPTVPSERTSRLKIVFTEMKTDEGWVAEEGVLSCSKVQHGAQERIEGSFCDLGSGCDWAAWKNLGSESTSKGLSLGLRGIQQVLQGGQPISQAHGVLFWLAISSGIRGEEAAVFQTSPKFWASGNGLSFQTGFCSPVGPAPGGSPAFVARQRHRATGRQGQDGASPRTARGQRVWVDPSPPFLGGYKVGHKVNWRSKEIGLRVDKLGGLETQLRLDAILCGKPSSPEDHPQSSCCW